MDKDRQGKKKIGKMMSLHNDPLRWQRPTFLPWHWYWYSRPIGPEAPGKR